MISRFSGQSSHTTGGPQADRWCVDSILTGEVLRDVFLPPGGLAQAVEQGQDARPVPQDLLAAGHQLAVKPRDVRRVSVLAGPHQLPDHLLQQGALLAGLGVAGAGGEELEAGPVVVRHLGSVSSCCTNQVGT